MITRDMKLAFISSWMLVFFTAILMRDVITNNATVTVFNAASFTVACLMLGYANRQHYISATATAVNGLFWLVILIKVII